MSGIGDIMRTEADGLTLLSALAVQAEIEKLVEQFEHRYGLKVHATYDVNPAVAKRIIGGEDVDIGLTNPWFVEEMVTLGRIVPNIHVPFGRVPLAIGAAEPWSNEILNSHEAVRAILLNAESIAYIASGTSGKTFLRALEMMGLWHLVHDRLRPMGAGEPPKAVAAGQVQYAVAPLSRIIAAPGAVPIATFPPDMGLNIDMSMFIGINSKRVGQADQLIQFLTDQQQDDYLRSKGVYRYTLQT
jgi:ABC-type molybdate transport system substrate-binding protein